MASKTRKTVSMWVELLNCHNDVQANRQKQPKQGSCDLKLDRVNGPPAAREKVQYTRLVWIGQPERRFAHHLEDRKFPKRSQDEFGFWSLVEGMTHNLRDKNVNNKVDMSQFSPCGMTYDLAKDKAPPKSTWDEVLNSLEDVHSEKEKKPSTMSV